MTFPANPLAPIPDHIEALIFDCDGTLVHTMPTHYRAWLAALTPYGIRFDEDLFYRFAGMSTMHIIKVLSTEQNIPVDVERVAHEKEDFYVQFVPGVSAILQVIDLVRRERHRRKLAVASGGWHRIVEASLSAVGVLDLFPVIVGADDVAHSKPYPDCFLKAAELLGVPPEKCLVFEDGEQGFEAARRANITAIDVRPWYMEGVTSSTGHTVL